MWLRLARQSGSNAIAVHPRRWIRADQNPVNRCRIDINGLRDEFALKMPKARQTRLKLSSESQNSMGFTVSEYEDRAARCSDHRCNAVQIDFVSRRGGEEAAALKCLLRFFLTKNRFKIALSCFYHQLNVERLPRF